MSLEPIRRVVREGREGGLEGAWVAVVEGTGAAWGRGAVGVKEGEVVMAEGRAGTGAMGERAGRAGRAAQEVVRGARGKGEEGEGAREVGERVGRGRVVVRGVDWERVVVAAKARAVVEKVVKGGKERGEGREAAGGG